VAVLPEAAGVGGPEAVWGNPSTKGGQEHTFATAKARYVRINLLKNSANSGLHLNEILVFEAK